jgi:conjugal transfer/entry exclusion protein
MTDLTDYPPIFGQLQKEIDYYHNMLQNVTKFRNMIQQKSSDGLFDEQDISWVDADIKELEKELQQRTAQFDKRKHLYENSILRLENILQQRKGVIETADNECQVLSDRSGLLEKFAQKRATLIKTVEQAKHELLSANIPQ